MGTRWHPSGPVWRRRRRSPIVLGDIPDADELTASQRRALARIRARRPDAVLIWTRRRDRMVLEISNPPTHRTPRHSLVVVAFDRDGSVHVDRDEPRDGTA
jgi:hypothetical protein